MEMTEETRETLYEIILGAELLAGIPLRCVDIAARHRPLTLRLLGPVCMRPSMPMVADFSSLKLSQNTGLIGLGCKTAVCVVMELTECIQFLALRLEIIRR